MSRQNPVRSTRTSVKNQQALQLQQSSRLSETQNNVFVVEKVLNKRFTRAGSEYLIKWQGFPTSEASWEPRENLQCDRMIQEYERESVKRSTRKRRYSPQPSSSADSEPLSNNSEDWIGKTLKMIIGITKAPGELHFLCKFTDESTYLIPIKDVNVRFPNQVIKYYESKLCLQGDPSSMGY